VALSALAPTGRANLRTVHDVVSCVRSADGWSPHPGLHVVAMNYSTGARAVFNGRNDCPADLADAVTASCAVPGWFTPVEINGQRYVDGGVLSATHADLAAGLGLDEVYVLAPTAAEDSAEAAAATPAWQRLIRSAMRRQLLREAATLHEDGTKAVLIAPGPADLSVMGTNMMDPARRIPVLETAQLSTAATLAEIDEGPAAARIPA
jgi:NTE family protein